MELIKLDKRKFAISYSCGKDSTLALYRMIKNGHIPVALIISVNKDVSRSWFHGVDEVTISQISKSLNIPVIKAFSSGDDYASAFIKALKEAKDMGAECCVFGDIDLEGHREWGEEICKQVSMEATFPLWKENRLSITNEFIDTGFTAVIKAVSKQFNLPKEMLGKTLTHEIVDEITKLGSDPCGENGEYHTFVYDGPIFEYAINYDTDGFFENEYAFGLVCNGKENK